MILHCKNDLGLISVTFEGIEVMVSDVRSIEVFDILKKYLLNLGAKLDLEYFDLDCATGVCSVYASSEVRNFVPSFTCACCLIFKQTSMLLKLYNIFAPKRKQIVLDDSDYKIVFNSGKRDESCLIDACGVGRCDNG